MDTDIVKQNGTTAPVEPPEDIFNAKSVVNTLETLIDRVTAEECNAQNVNAACNAAARITDILRLHLDVEKFRAKKG